MGQMIDEQDLVYRLLKRAEIRRQIPSRKSVRNGEPDRIADLLEESANYIKELRMLVHSYQQENIELRRDRVYEPAPYWTNPNWKPPVIT